MLLEVNAEPESASVLRQACAELERRLRAGEAWSAEAVLAEHPELKSDADAALEVIYTEFVAREALGQRPAPAEFCTRFPEWRDGLEQLFQIHGAVGVGSGGGSVGPAGLSGTPFPGIERWRSLTGSGCDGAPRRVGNYEVLGEVGRGGMGVVYKARQVELNRLVALKMILTGADAGPKERARFHAEAEAAARLQHPNIVHIHEVGEHEGRPFLSLEYVDGGSLEELLTGAPWPATEAARLIETLARAMHHAHEQGIVHRDLKPANILLSKSSTDITVYTDSKSPTSLLSESVKSVDVSSPKITDFGLARLMASASLGCAAGTELTAAGAILGTPAYMAPEQAAGTTSSSSLKGGEGGVGPAADVYGLGAILYELLTGRPPFQGVNVLETLEQVRMQEPLPPSRLQPALPVDIETICLKCLRKETYQRYGSAKDLADDLARFLSGEPVRARPTPVWEKVWKWAKRRPAVAALLASVVVVTAIGLTSVTVLWRQTAAALDAVKAERDDKEAALAANLIVLAHREWLANDTEAARRHLDDCPPAHRSPEWHYLHRVCHACLFILSEPRQSARGEGLAWSPDGRYLACNQFERLAKVWDTTTGRECGGLPRRPTHLAKLAFEADGRLVSLSWPLTPQSSGVKTLRPIEVKVWELQTPREVLGFSATLLRYHHPVLSGDARRVAVAGPDVISIIDVRSGEILTTVAHHAKSAVHSLALSADGRMLAWVSDGKAVHVWDTAAAERVGPVLAAAPTRLVFSPDGGRLALLLRQADLPSGVVQVRNCRTGEHVVTLGGHTQVGLWASFSPDGRRLATASADRTVIVWDLDKATELLTLRGHLTPVSVVEFSPDGTRLASASNDGTVRIWDAGTRADRND